MGFRQFKIMLNLVWVGQRSGFGRQARQSFPTGFKTRQPGPRNGVHLAGIGKHWQQFLYDSGVRETPNPPVERTPARLNSSRRKVVPQLAMANEGGISNGKQQGERACP